MTSLITHLLALLIGLVIGRYFLGNPGSAASAGQPDKTLRRLYKQYPQFFTTLRDDLSREEFRRVREFAILDSAQSTFVSENVKLIYYEDELAELKTIAGALDEHGYIDEVTRGKTPLYRLRESFVTALRSLDSSHLTALAKSADSWSVYIVRCADNSLYTGVARDLEQRIEQHNGGRGAKYTRSRLPVELVYSESAASRSAALRREFAIKQLQREQKQKLIESGQA